MPKPRIKRVVVFANGLFNNPDTARKVLLEDDLLIAADGGLHHCLELGLTPDILIGDFDSINNMELASLRTAGTEIIHQARFLAI